MINQLIKKDSPEIVFVLKGDPTYMGSSRFSGQMSAESRSYRLRDAVTVKNQYEEALMHKPLELFISFFFPLPSRSSHHRWGKSSEDFHTDFPQLSHTLKYVEDLMKNIAYKDSVIIAKVSAQKRYDSDPRTEFYFREL